VRRFVAEAVREGLEEYHSNTSPETGDWRPEPVVAPNFGSEAEDVAAPAPEQKPLEMGFSEPRAPMPIEKAAPTVSAAAPQPSTLNPQPPQAPPLLQVPLKIIGVVGKLYVVLESDRGLVLMDQHAAHERVLYEQLLEQMEREETASQKLLLPETVELSATDAAFVAEQVDALSRLGVGISAFGERTFLLDALPPFVKVKDAKGFVLSLIDELKSVGSGINSMRLGEDMVTKTVCRHAIKANDALAAPELDALLESLRHCTMPYTCPHGRPCLIEMSYPELEKKFGRTV